MATLGWTVELIVEQFMLYKGYIPWWRSYSFSPFEGNNVYVDAYGRQWECSNEE